MEPGSTERELDDAAYNETVSSSPLVTRVSGVLPPGTMILGKYKVVSLIAEGGFARVYKVRHNLLKKDFALKVLSTIDAEASTKRRMKLEAESTSRLDHPNLVKAFDFDFINDMPFIILELVEGPTLGEYCKSHGKLSVSQALDIFLPVCYGLAYAHEMGVIHRDLKPGNIMLARDETEAGSFIPKVVDFGIAKSMQGEEGDLTRTGDKFGTPLYMSPEQCSAAGADERSDIYALGCVLFEALTGTPPFRGTTALETMVQHVNCTVPTLKEASLGEEFPPALERIVAKMLAKEPRDRYQNFMAVGQDLILSQQGKGERIQVVAMRSNRVTRHRRAHSIDWVSASLALFCGLTIGSLGLGLAVMKLEPNSDVSKAMNKIAAPAKIDTSIDSDFGSLNVAIPLSDAGYFQEEPDSKSPLAKFVFPKELGLLGKMYWWTGRRGTLGSWRVLTASGTVNIPKGHPIMLDCSPELYHSPFYMAHFRSHDLNGVIADRASVGQTAEESDAFLLALSKQLSLWFLSLDGWDCAPTTFQQLAHLDVIRRLSLSNIHLYVHGSQRQLSCKDVCELPLELLTDLKLHRVTDVPTGLKRFSRLPYLRALSIGDSTSLDEDGLKLIGTMLRLDTLDLRSSKLHACSGAEMDCLADLPNLRRLAIDYTSFATRPKKQLKSLRLLVLCGVHTTSKAVFARELKAALPPHFDIDNNLILIRAGDRSRLVDSWFDFRLIDPYNW